jgi:ABC-type oligopeptide transport system substrate-binding subunit
MEAAEAEGDRVVVVRFTPNRARSAPLTVANLPILSKAYYTAHPFDETSMEPPLGSGPTRSASSSRAATWNSNGSRTGGAPTCRSPAAVQFRRAAV